MIDPRDTELAELRAQVRRLQAQLAEARELIPEENQWCEDCGTYADDFTCLCARCPDCGVKMPGEDAAWPEPCAACLAAERAAEHAAAAALQRRRREVRREYGPPWGPRPGRLQKGARQ